MADMKLKKGDGVKFTRRNGVKEKGVVASGVIRTQKGEWYKVKVTDKQGNETISQHRPSALTPI